MANYLMKAHNINDILLIKGQEETRTGMLLGMLLCLNLYLLSHSYIYTLIDLSIGGSVTTPLPFSMRRTTLTFDCFARILK
jgi:hypothetical protein